MISLLTKKIYKNFSYSMLLSGIGLFAVGLLAGYMLWDKPQTFDAAQKRANDPKLIFTNPLLSCSVSETKEFKEYKSLEAKINTLVEKLDPNKEDTASVYYRDLTTGRWFSINEELQYSPASLLKVPIMIAYLKEAESNPGILSKKIFYDGHTLVTNSIEHYTSKDSIKAGNSYTVDQLITSMIEHSDNSATVLLFNDIDNNSLIEVMTDIGLKLPPDTGVAASADDYMTVKSYSYLFRLLYNSTYLNRNMSEKALRLLSYADFDQGIVKGIPKGVKTAQKFGERTILDSAGKVAGRELHDCGIVYPLNHPYLLCIMTKGNDFETLSTIISEISKTVYTSVTNK